ncbi:MAG: D-sedoheptulose-7-phosphate isomerase [Flavobacteriales bacterium]|jgi:D-sedoheptulose 7-phosphate isomerase|tara:strand:- start:7873 stop:8448 length:576 start_codon:yes stop_codon:yes gene_type:complete
MRDSITKILKKAADNIYNVSIDKDIIFKIEQIVDLCIKAYENNQRILFCGNGGSASDAQHIAAELSGRFLKDRKPLFAEALHVNSSYLTAVSNDYGFEYSYSRILESAAREGDVLIALSTSGNSKNVLKAIEKANSLGVISVGLSGVDGGEMQSLCSIMINIPSKETARIQESHILVGHIICELIEDKLFS